MPLLSLASSGPATFSGKFEVTNVAMVSGFFFAEIALLLQFASSLRLMGRVFGMVIKIPGVIA